MSAPTAYELTIFKGATFRQSLVWQDSDGVPVDLTGYSARMQVRKTINTEAVVVELSTFNGSILLQSATGAIEMHLSAAQTSVLIGKTGVYDLEMESADGTVTRLLYGDVTLSPEVTR